MYTEQDKDQGAELFFLMAQDSAIKFVHTLQYQKASSQGN